MLSRPPNAPPRLGMGRIEAAVASVLLVTALGLLIPGCYQRTIGSSARTQSTNNLKQITLAFHGFHDANRRLPFNGTKDASAGDATSGSWAFQILPYIDQAPLFSRPDNTTAVWAYMCPGRGRQPVQAGFGAWTDYFINNYVNDPTNAETPNNPDAKRTLVGITDGSSNTIIAGQGRIATGDYGHGLAVVGSHNIFIGGGPGTMRGGPNWVKGSIPKVSVERDSAAPPDLGKGGWGGPFPQGCLVGLGDATVRMFPYSMSLGTFGAFLTPTGGETCELPD